MSLRCFNSKVIRKQISLLFFNNIRRGLVFLWCSVNVIIYQIKTLFIRNYNRLISVHHHQCFCLHSCEKMSENGTPIDNLNTKNGNFICGVVEGFYGRPWTTDQRKDLFQKMKKWGMDSYLYAPKDDYKHRAYWRELYTVEEAEHLTGLISAARDNGIHFYYALSPGLDITYSSVKEVAALKRKLEQVSQFGCNAFALLFDDIEPEMSEADKEVFQSFAHAQVSVTNDIYQHLGQPRFMICPTQYCAARAMPNVSNSEYLNTLGSKLAPEIDIMWTGNKVISRVISVESIEEITDVLKRPPLIWDNLHANDYDQKRVFLGPYQGRSPDLIPKLRGVLTNPNCEFGANFVAIHTLAQWSRCNVDGKRDINDTVSADIKLETETEDGGVGEDVPTSLPANMYHPRRALRNAIQEWLPEFRRVKQAWGPITKPQPALPLPLPLPVIIPSVNTCMSVTTTTNTAASAGQQNTNQLQALAEVCSTVNGNESLMQPVSNCPIVMNSLISESKVMSEPMDCNSTPTNSPAHIKATPTQDVPMDNNSGSGGLSSSSSMTMQVEPVSESNLESDERPRDADKELTLEDLALLCDLFYLPFEHGSQGVQLLQEFNWLKSNAHLITLQNAKTSETTPEIQEWHERAAKLEEMSQSVNRLFQRLTFAHNRELLYDLYPYVWDMRGVISLLNSYIKWLAKGRFPQMVSNYTLGNYTWFSKGWKESFMSGDQEPWVFRGGLTADLQRLIPVDAGSDLFVYKAPEVPCSKIYTVRPYLPEDEPGVYSVCRKTYMFSSPALPNLIPDRLVGAFLTLSPELSMIVEDETGIVGYAVAALDARQFYGKVRLAWLPEMCQKYPATAPSEKSTPEEDMIKWFHSPMLEDVPDSIHTQHPSVMSCSLLSTVFDQSVAKRLIICLLAALRANGSFGVYVPVSSQDRALLEFYSKLGFVELSQGASQETMYLGRIF
ncbi:protein O-GlcNAcase isoform X2 [Macrosteles quadrilineatus]|uniref:protein O-GlcNAcase isoform X2 n=1 Tax=Macrosteles quadrilineatus TaxID=74068 RepID=UPI0023E1F3BC|nr:protein O-GlcNAcase isoform X2 [Macrosteles quadrilineatus]